MNAVFNFNNTYLNLPEMLYSKCDPETVPQPEIVFINRALADTLGITLSHTADPALAHMFSGNQLPTGAQPLAQAYAGHQFGHFTNLGDGRAHLIGEQITPDNKRYDIQLKGSGRTPYSRRGDGRAALGPMLREVIISEAMHHLGIPTTRSLAVVTTGELIYRETEQPGAILTRAASSHIRVGTFEYLAAHRDQNALSALADYSIARHYPALKETRQPYLAFLSAVMEKQIELVTEWMRVGFIHGVMNTDNVTISGETIDYGPCAFMDTYDPSTVFSAIDHTGRYAYASQAKITTWNIARFAEAILPLIDKDPSRAVAMAKEVIDTCDTKFQLAWLNMMRRKLGLLAPEKDDLRLIEDLLSFMQRQHMDYTNTFRKLSEAQAPTGGPFETDSFKQWYSAWQKRLTNNPKPMEVAKRLMQASNPAIIPRNHRVEAALKSAQHDADYAAFNALLTALTRPYDAQQTHTDFSMPPEPSQRVYQTFCGT